MAMDFISGPTTTAATATNIPRSPDSDTDTPPHPPPLKRAHHQHLVPHSGDNNSSSVHVSYKECLKNHAASIGGHALDGCCEFMPGPSVNPMDPTTLTCAACGCHRNFHRRDPDDPTPLHHLIPHSTLARKAHSPPTASQLLLSLSGNTHSPSAPSDHDPTNNHHNNNNNITSMVTGVQNGNFQSKKRFRTKFSQEQKEKMHEFSEKIGWKLKKGEEKLVQDFCNSISVDRSVFKVWMHNNKHSSSSTPTTTTPPPPSSVSLFTTTKDQKISSSSNNKDTTNGSSINNLNTSSSNNNNNNNNNSSNNNVGMNCGGMLGSGHLEFSFANGGAQETKAQ